MWSGGKDSTASIILAHKHNIHIDLVVVSEVMYDHSRGISAEHPLHADWMHNYAIPLFRTWGFPVVVVRAERDFLTLFHHPLTRARTNMDGVGKPFGFPLANHCYVQRDLKRKAVDAYLASSLGTGYTSIVGIAADEPRRLESLHRNPSSYSLLEQFGLTQTDALQLCADYGLLSPCYNLSKRGGCFFCPWVKEKEIAAMYDYSEESRQVLREFAALESVDCAYPLWSPYRERFSHMLSRIESDWRKKNEKNQGTD